MSKLNESARSLAFFGVTYDDCGSSGGVHGGYNWEVDSWKAGPQIEAPKCIIFRKGEVETSVTVRNRGHDGFFDIYGWLINLEPTVG